MAFEQKDNSGALFKNAKKEKETHPDYQGECVVNGQKLRIAAWLKTSSKGTRYMSLAFSEPQERPQTKPKGKFDDMEDDIPW